MKRVIRFGLGSALLLLVSLLLVTASSAQEEVSPIKISLVPNKTSYAPGEPIRIQIKVYNNTSGEVITHRDFMDRDFHLMVTFTDPDGVPIRTLYQGALDEPLATPTINNKFVFNVEIIPSDWEGIWVMDDASKWYGNFTKRGRYTVQAVVTFETFSSAFVDPDTGVDFAYADDSLATFNPIPTDPIAFEIASQEVIGKSSVHAKVKHLKIGDGARPKVEKKSLSGSGVYLYKTSTIPESYYPINYKAYQTIWDNLIPFKETSTDRDGIAKFSSLLRDEYLVLVKTGLPFSPTMGKLIEMDDSNWFEEEPIVKHLMVMEKVDGKKVPGKTKKLTGSELLVTEPEYVEWDGNQEVYPFVFESIGDWGVTTSVTPPEGFVSDNESLSAEVTNELEAIQFTVTDVGSEWKTMCVNHRRTHNKRKKDYFSTIGVKLTRELAEEKGIDLWGEAETARESSQLSHEETQECRERAQEIKQGDGGDGKGGKK
jgi:hypothetical protein